MPIKGDVTLGVDIDEAGRDDSSGRIDNGVGPVDLGALTFIEDDNASVFDRNSGSSFPHAGSVDDASVTNESVDVHCRVS